MWCLFWFCKPGKCTESHNFRIALKAAGWAGLCQFAEDTEVALSNSGHLLIAQSQEKDLGICLEVLDCIAVKKHNRCSHFKIAAT